MDGHEHVIDKKTEVMIEHFHENVAKRINGQAKAMVVTRSRLHAVRYHLAFDRHLQQKGYPYKALVAFSGTVKDPDSGAEFTEAGMNGFPDTQTAEEFKKPEYRFLIVANKFQTGFDEKLLHTMYVVKKLGGVNAV
jgi:type I restriction enzyme R subunit